MCFKKPNVKYRIRDFDDVILYMYIWYKSCIQIIVCAYFDICRISPRELKYIWHHQAMPKPLLSLLRANYCSLKIRCILHRYRLIDLPIQSPFPALFRFPSVNGLKNRQYTNITWRSQWRVRMGRIKCQLWFSRCQKAAVGCHRSLRLVPTKKLHGYSFPEIQH